MVAVGARSQDLAHRQPEGLRRQSFGGSPSHLLADARLALQEAPLSGRPLTARKAMDV